MRHDLYLWRADHEDCSKDKEKVDQIFSYTSFHYIMSGYGYFNGIRLGAGQFFCAVKNRHACYYPDREDPWCYSYFDFAGEEADNTALIGQLTGDLHCGDFCGMEEIRQILQLYFLYVNRHQDNPAFIRALGDMVLSLHRQPVSERTAVSAVDRHAAEIQKYIDTHFHEKLTVEGLADRFFLSRPYVRNLFVRNMGLSPKQYLQKVRMDKAGELLRQTDYEIRLIASSVGYSDQLAFSKVFRRHFGCSPTQLRNEEQEERNISSVSGENVNNKL